MALERTLAWHFARVTEAAALAAGRWIGRGRRKSADGAAVDAMRTFLDGVPAAGTIVIGEGERDKAPMLYIGERVGGAAQPRVDIAVDPLEGTNLVAKAMPNSIAVLALAPEGSLLHAPDIYMDKIAVGPQAKGHIDLEAPIKDNLAAIARAKGCPLAELTVVMLERPRHKQILEEVRQAGARVRLISDGDVAPAILAALPGGGVDVLLGVGGAPEGVLAAAALKCLGGEMQARFWPQNEEEIARAQAMGADVQALLSHDDLVRGDDVIFVATGITDGNILKGVRYRDKEVHTHTLLLHARTGMQYFAEANYNLDRNPMLKEVISRQE